jgi:hypothetical protein
MFCRLSYIGIGFRPVVAKRIEDQFVDRLFASTLLIYPSDLKMLVSARIKWLSDKAPI